MTGLAAAERHPVGAVAMFFAAVVALVLLVGWNVWAAFAVAVVIGAVLMVAFVVDVSAPYRTLDCRDEHHTACEECWCECHAPEAVHLSEVA